MFTIMYNDFWILIRQFFGRFWIKFYCGRCEKMLAEHLNLFFFSFLLVNVFFMKVFWSNQNNNYWLDVMSGGVWWVRLSKTHEFDIFFMLCVCLRCHEEEHFFVFRSNIYGDLAAALLIKNHETFHCFLWSLKE